MMCQGKFDDDMTQVVTKQYPPFTEAELAQLKKERETAAAIAKICKQTPVPLSGIMQAGVAHRVYDQGDPHPCVGCRHVRLVLYQAAERSTCDLCSRCIIAHDK